MRAQSRCWLSYPFVSGISWIAFIVKYSLGKNVIKIILPEMWPPNFHLISNLNLGITVKSNPQLKEVPLNRWFWKEKKLFHIFPHNLFSFLCCDDVWTDLASLSTLPLCSSTSHTQATCSCVKPKEVRGPGVGGEGREEEREEGCSPIPAIPMVGREGNPGKPPTPEKAAHNNM